LQHEAKLDFRVAEQTTLLHELAAAYGPEMRFAEDGNAPPWEYHRNNGLFETVDADIAYALVRRRKPQRIVEVGSGFSTRLLATAVRRNTVEGHPCELVSIDPYPDPVLSSGIAGLEQLVRVPVQQAPDCIFDSLRPGDVLFIDSSHVVGVGSDVVHLVLNILPRVPPGVLVHVHDIFLPLDYPQQMVFDGLCFWSEQYLLEAFLQFNREFRIVWSASLMQCTAMPELEEAIPQWRHSWTRLSAEHRQFIPTFDRQHVWPSSFWMERV
jgi:predicted O-methyltransferase YrrM